MNYLTLFGLKISIAPIALGLIIGMTYGLLAVGLILIFRANKIINFAHGEIGAFGAAIMALITVRWHFPYWIGFPLALLCSGGLGVLVELAVIRRLRAVPRIMSVVATLGAAQFILLFSFAIAGEIRSSTLFPQPPGLPEFKIGGLPIRPAFSGMLLLTPLVVAGVALFLRYTRYGLAIRGSESNPERARLSGIYASRMSSLTWFLAGIVSAFTALLVLPTRGLATTEALGPAMLMRALVPAVLARMSSFTVALIGGIAVGILEQVLLLNSSGGTVEMIFFVVVLIGLIAQPREQARVREKGSWAMVQPSRPMSEALSKVWAARNFDRIVVSSLLGLALLIPLLSTNRTAAVFVSIISFALVGLSIVLITGLVGQLSLGQFALAGIGATVSFHVARISQNFLLAIFAGALAAGAAAIVIGLPALRVRGLMLAVTTLSFALASNAWLFQRSWMLGSGVASERPSIGPFTFDTGKSYYLFALVFLLLGFALFRNLRRRGIGRILISIRDNEEAARSFGVYVTRRKLQAFVFSGFLAGLGGAVYAHGLASISFQTFSPGDSIKVVAMTILGGVGALAGPLMGALYIIGIPAFVPLDAAGLAASSFGWFVFILYFPGGISELVRPLRERLLNIIAKRHGIESSTLESKDKETVASHLSSIRLKEPQPLFPSSNSDSRPQEASILTGVALTKSFGGLRALDDVTIEVFPGETLGVIGPNGAGKTTLFDVLSGFVLPERGSVVFDGRDVTRSKPEVRATLGLIRSFQDAFLYPTLSVLDTIRLARERVAPASFLSEALGFSKAERLKDEVTRSLVSVLGLDPFRHKQIREISTGTRRIVELGALVALEPKLLLLDEPSSGIAQRETEALGELLNSLKSYMEATLVVIEHDMPMITTLADRMIAIGSTRFPWTPV